MADGQGVEELSDRHRRADVARGGPLLQQRAAWAVRQLRGRALALLPGRDLRFGRAVASETEAPSMFVNLEESEEQQEQNEQQQHKVDEPRRRGTMRPSPVATVRLPSAASADSASPRKPKVSRPSREHALSL